MPQLRDTDDTISSLERVREGLYDPGGAMRAMRNPLSVPAARVTPSAWGDPLPKAVASPRGRQRHFARWFFIAALAFFFVALGIAAYFLYYGGNAVSLDKISIGIQGPVAIAGGDTVPLLVTVTNTNAAAIEHATIEINFPSGTRSATDVLAPYPRYVEDLGTLASGATVTRSVEVLLFGGAGESFSLPVSLSYGTAASNAVFVKKVSYAITISSTPLSVSVDAPPAVTAGESFSIALTVRSTAPVPLHNVVLSGAFPFGFSAESSSPALQGSSFLLGTLQPGAEKTVTLTGTIFGQDADERVFRFAVGTAKAPNDQTIAIAYMTQDAPVTIASPFISATLALNGDSSGSAVLAPGGVQTVSVSYSNTLPTNIANASVTVAISGSAVDYDSIRASRGFYRSVDRTIVFNRDTDTSLALLAPGASGLGSFTFSTLPAGAVASSPTVTFTIAVSGTPSGDSGTARAMSASVVTTAKVSTAVALSSSALHAAGPLGNSGPVPPRADQATTYTVLWNVRNAGSAVADGVVSATLPSYVSYTGAATGSFSYDEVSHVVAWKVGDLGAGASAQGAFQVSFIPSTSQRGAAPVIAGTASFSGHDRFAGVSVSATADPVTTETKGDPGYVAANGIVQ